MVEILEPGALTSRVLLRVRPVERKIGVRTKLCTREVA